MMKPRYENLPRLASLIMTVVLLAGCTADNEPRNPKDAPSPDRAESVDADAGFGAFEEISFEGLSSERVELPDDVRDAEAVLFDVRYEEGQEPLMLFTTDAKGGFDAVVLDTFLPITGGDHGTFSGQTMILGDGSGTHLDVEAAGAWRITLRPASTAPELPEAGAGHGVFRYSGPGGDVGVQGTGAEGGFLIEQSVPGAISPTQAAFLEFEEETADASLEPGPSLVRVAHNGSWSLDLP